MCDTAHHIHGCDTAYSYGGIRDIDSLYVRDRDLEFCITPPD